MVVRRNQPGNIIDENADNTLLAENWVQAGYLMFQNYYEEGLVQQERTPAELVKNGVLASP